MNKLNRFGLTLLSVASVYGAAEAKPKAKRPNILFAIADDISMESMSAYGLSTGYIQTPAFDRVAREGVLLNNAFCCNPKSSPARAVLLTGRYSWQLEEAADHFGYFPDKWVSYPELLSAAGYHVGYTGKPWSPGVHGRELNPAGREFAGKTMTPPASKMSNKDYAANFEDFLKQKDKDQPFCFWYGGHEAHRAFEKGSGVKSGKDLSKVKLPEYYPDSKEIRSDFLDYALEVEWYDTHLGRMLDALEKSGELNNTLIVVTSDHGMSFPRAKGQIYQNGFHVPMAIMWKGKIKPGRVVEDFVNFPDIAPTFLEVAGLPRHEQITGRSITDILYSNKNGWVDENNNKAIVGKERHDMGRASYDGAEIGYPARALRKGKYLFIINFKPDRWPVGNPEYGLRNCDDGPTKSYINSLRFNNNPMDRYYWDMSFGHRPAEELYDISVDPDCVKNLIQEANFTEIAQELKDDLMLELNRQKDPRVLGNGDVFDKYQHYGTRKVDYSMKKPQ
ncbi:MAG: sulfatase family protein [Bacteroidales bacterium]